MKKLIMILLVLTLGLASISHALRWDDKNIIVGSDDGGVTFYQVKANSDGSLSVTGSTTTAGLFTDSRYDGKISTTTANKIIATGDITPTFEVINWSFLSKGGDTTIAGSNINGTIYVLEDIAINGEFINPVDSPTFTATLPASTTLYYIITGVE